MIGEQVHQYRILRSLGRGGMGEVYLAEDTNLKRKVALKFLGAEYREDESFRIRFHREAQAAAKLNHPNVITVFETGDWNNRPFIAMRYVEGESLGSFLQRSHTSLSEKFRLAVAIADGLTAAHQAGIVHRDLKPSNIMLDSQRCPILLDFGLAKLASVSSITSRNSRMGTLAYMSPEQTRSEPVDHRSDIFSLGVILYEMFTAHPPFTGEYEPAIVYAIAFETPKPLADHRADFPIGLQRVIDQALMKSPADRYQRMEDMLGDLKLLEIGREPEAAASEDERARRESPSVAALYLKNLGSEEDEFLSYGLTEDLIVDLTRLGTIRVQPMRATLVHKDSTENIKVIGEKLGVEFVLDGSIHKDGETIRISIQLIEASSGTNLWAEKWENDLSDLPTVKREIIEGIKQSLGIKYEQQPKSGITTVINNPHAYEFYLRGRFAFDHKKSESDVAVATGFFKQASSEEPTFLAARCGVAETLIHTGNYDEAAQELTAALSESRRRKDRSSESTILRLLAQSLEKQSRWDEAKKFAHEALKVSRDIENFNEEAEALAVLIQLALRRADLDAALNFYDRALEISRILGDENKVVEVLRKIANIYMRKGEVKRAMPLYEKALKIAIKRNDIIMQARCVSNQGLAYYQLGEFQLARSLSNQALDMRKELGDESGEVASLNILGLIESSLGKYQQAITLFTHAAEISERIRDKASYSLSLTNRAYNHSILGVYKLAETAADTALEIALQIDYPLIEINATKTLGIIKLREGEFADAERYLTNAMNKSLALKLSPETAEICTELAELHIQKKNYPKAKELAERALRYAKSSTELAEEIKASAFVHAIDALSGDFIEGIRSLRETLAHAEKFGDPRIIIHVQRLLGQTLMAHGREDSDTREGIKILSEAKSRSRELQIAYEEKWIGDILAIMSGDYQSRE